MKESVQAARAYIRSRSFEFGIEPKVFEKKDIHVHVPEGATPKDGPSAGVAMCTTMVSAFTGIVQNRITIQRRSHKTRYRHGGLYLSRQIESLNRRRCNAGFWAHMQLLAGLANNNITGGRRRLCAHLHAGVL